jgi:membrane protease YdiL (CAAX protease family)
VQANDVPGHLTPSAASGYGFAAVLLIWFSTLISYKCVSYIWALTFVTDDGSIYYQSALAILIVAGLALYRRPRLLSLSKWVPRPLDLALAIPLGVFFVFEEILLLPDQMRVPLPPGRLLPWLVISIGPFGEELLMRGICLRSLQEREPVWFAIASITLLSAIGHPSFWSAIPSQLLLCVFYTVRQNSLAASLALHVTINAMLVLHVERFFHR